MKKTWGKPTLRKISVQKITLTGSGSTTENTGKDVQSSKRP
jgi:hypothetical protein